MAENNAKTERPSVTLNIWFVIFLVYLIFSLAYIFSLVSSNEAYKAELANKNTEISNMQTSTQDKISNLSNTLAELSDKLALARNEVDELLGNGETNTTIATGIYSGSSNLSGDEQVAMTLTLAEEGVASLIIVNASGDTDLNGTYTYAENVLVFTSEDAAVTYTFTVIENGALELADGTIVLSLNI